MPLKHAVLCAACAMLWLSSAMAQQRAAANPADPRAAVSSAQYQSAFAGYQPFRDEKLVPWREVNDEAARVGGHLGIFRSGAHAGHSGMSPTTEAPAAAAQKSPDTMQRNDHQGMTK